MDLPLGFLDAMDLAYILRVAGKLLRIEPLLEISWVEADVP
jgi:hypothetical protein